MPKHSPDGIAIGEAGAAPRRASLGFRQFVLGTDAMTFANRRDSFAVLDTFAAKGGTIIDTARSYGQSERIVGEWLRANDASERMTLITKGGHPDALWRSRMSLHDLLEDAERSVDTLDRRIDCYLLHRDDDSVPAEEIASALTSILRHGLCERVGVSNWTVARISALQSELSTHGVTLSVVSNYFGLALPSGPAPSPGVKSVTLGHVHQAQENDHFLLAWGSFSAGFFTGSAIRPLGEYAGLENATRLRALLDVASSFGVPPAALLARWLSTADELLKPVVRTSRPENLAAVLEAAQSAGLDTPVRELAVRVSGGPDRRFPSRSFVPEW